ncbi:MAG: pentapeptide repeat-containing protein [Planctomycetes bacterium]|nr:pentapeptide repeat-containing protein [Planctomycetota bacterium]
MITPSHTKNQSLLLSLFLVVAFSALPTQAEIYKWEFVDPGEPSLGKRESATLVPDGAGVEAMPGAELYSRDLTMAYLINKDLTGAKFSGAKLTDADLTGANLNTSDLRNVMMIGANFTNAQIRGALLSVNENSGISAEQFYSTASYRTKDLSTIYLERSNISGWNFIGQNLTNTRFNGANMTSANLESVNLTGAYLGSAVLTNVNLAGANLTGVSSYEAIWTNTDLTGTEVRGASFARFMRGTGITTAQLYSTASYQAKDITGIGLSGNDLSDWDFSGQNLTSATFNSATLANTDLSEANLTEARFFRAKLTDANLSGSNLNKANFRDTGMNGANLTGATISGARFSSITDSGFTPVQLYSTANYQAKDLTRIFMENNNLNGWNFAEQNLSYARFFGSTLISADLNGANLTNVVFLGAELSNANLRGANLTDAEFDEVTLTNTDLTGANLTNVGFEESTLDNANLRGANLSEIDFVRSTLANTILVEANLTGAFFFSTVITGADLTGADLRAALIPNLSSALTDNLIQPDGRIHGLNLVEGQRLLVRDYDGNPSTFIPIEPISITIEQRLSMDTGGELRFFFETDPWDSLISFEPGIPVMLEGGAVILDFADEVEIATQIGRTFQIFDWTGVSPSGKFSIQSDYRWDLSQLYSAGKVTLLAVPEPATGSIFLLGAFCSITIRWRVTQTN